MNYIKLTDNHLPEKILNRILVGLKKGAVIGYPTETVYGLGCDVFNSSAVKRIFNLKGRDFTTPLIILINDKASARSLTTNIPEVAERLMDAYWPGPLTMIFKVSSKVPAVVTAGKNTIGLRISSDPVCKILLENYKSPLISTSANPTGFPPAISADEAIDYFKSKLDIVIDAGMRNHSKVSTVIDVTCDTPRILRSGAITDSEIFKCIEKKT